MEVCAADRDEFDGEEHYTSHMWQLPHCRSLRYCALACLLGIDWWFPWVVQAADAGVCVCLERQTRATCTPGVVACMSQCATLLLLEGN